MINYACAISQLELRKYFEWIIIVIIINIIIVFIIVVVIIIIIREGFQLTINYSRTFTNGHFSTAATFFCPQGGPSGEVRL